MRAQRGNLHLPGDLRTHLPAGLCTFLKSVNSVKTPLRPTHLQSEAMRLTRLKPGLGENLEVLHCELKCQRSARQLALLSSVV